jgi:hypothetical protein
VTTDRRNCPVDGTEMRLVVIYDSGHAEAECTSCHARYQVHGQFEAKDVAAGENLTAGKGPVFMRCPYDQGDLLLMHQYGYAKMARFKCGSAGCLFEIVQGHTA